MEEMKEKYIYQFINNNIQLPNDRLRHRSIIVTAPHSSGEVIIYYKHCSKQYISINRIPLYQLKLKNIQNYTSHRNKNRTLCYAYKNNFTLLTSHK